MAAPGAAPAAGVVVVGIEEYEPQIEEVQSYLAWWWNEGFTESGRLATIENDFNDLGLTDQAIEGILPNAYNTSIMQLMTRPLGEGTFPGILEGAQLTRVTPWGAIGYDYIPEIEHIILRVVVPWPAPAP